jgi:transketolase
MGEAHHVLEDLAIYTSFPDMKIYCPAFIEDVDIIVKKMYKEPGPSYLRLNLAPPTSVKLPPYSPVRQLVKGGSITILVLGYLIHNVIEAVLTLGKRNKVDVWCITELPLKLPDNLFFSLQRSKRIIVIEEHTSRGGLNTYLLSYLIKLNIHLKNYIHLYARGYPSGYYGSHRFHLNENDLSPAGIIKHIKTLL